VEMGCNEQRRCDDVAHAVKVVQHAIYVRSS
jgi:hypothetical protein